MLRHLYVCLSLLLAALPGCEPKDPLPPELVEFVFVIPARITPGADTVARGDTLWLTLDFPDSLLDLRSQRRVRIRPEDLALTASVGFKQLVGPDQYAVGAASAFATAERVGQLLPGGPTFRRWQLAYDGQRYSFRCGVVPQRPGVYALSLLNVVDTPLSMRFLSLPPAPDGTPRRARLRDIYYVINDGNVHFNIQQQHSRVVTLQPDASERAIYYEQKAHFTFVVR